MEPSRLSQQMNMDFRSTFDNEPGKRSLKTLLTRLNFLQPLRASDEIVRYNAALSIIHELIGGKDRTSELIDGCIDVILTMLRTSDLKEKPNG